MDWGLFFKVLSVATIFVGMMTGVGYWVFVLMQKKYPDMRFWIKYHLLRKKHNPSDVAMLLEDAEQGIDEQELLNALILSNKVDPKRAKELLYIYREIKTKLKGGVENE